MCLGIPMKIVKIDGDEGVLETKGLRRKANLSLVKEPKIGDYVILHAGFAIEKIKEKETRETLKVISEIEI